MLAHLAAHARSRNLRYGWRRRTVTWRLDLTDPRTPQVTPHGELELVPYVRRSGPGAQPRPVDNVDYLVGRHAAAWKQVAIEAADGSTHPVARAVPRADLSQAIWPAAIKPADVVAITAHGQWWHEDPALHAWWEQRLRDGLAAGSTDLCLACGGVGELARLVPAYLPPVAFGTTGTGDLSLLPTPTGSAARGRKTSAAQVCVDCAMGVGAAVAHLVDDPDHHRRLPGAGLLLWWASDGPLVPVGRLLAEPSREELHRAAGEGWMCVLLLTARAKGRISVQRWWRLPTSSLVGRIAAWYDRIEVVDHHTGEVRLHGIPALHAQAVGRWDAQAKAYRQPRTSSLREEELWMAALEGYPPRRHAHAALTARDNRVSAGRVALIQAGRG